VSRGKWRLARELFHLLLGLFAFLPPRVANRGDFELRIVFELNEFPEQTSPAATHICDVHTIVCPEHAVVRSCGNTSCYQGPRYELACSLSNPPSHLLYDVLYSLEQEC
jgi:hypothetical protein